MRNLRRPTPYTGTKPLNDCYEVESRLPAYSGSPGGQEVLRKAMPLLDDWAGGKPNGWDYGAVLRDNNVTVEWGDKLTSDGTLHQGPARPVRLGLLLGGMGPSIRSDHREHRPQGRRPLREPMARACRHRSATS